ncbi:MAG: divalent cation transporter [Pirellulaceae bacterium]
MNAITELILLTSIAGGAIPLGALIASIEHIQPKWLESEVRHTIIAFGGGALLAAVAFVLIPRGTDQISTPESVLAFALGGFTFWGLQLLLDRSASHASQLAAMMSDFIPEVIALGATIALGEGGTILLAAIITLQNVPEGFNAFRELQQGGLRSRTILKYFAAAACFGPILGAGGYVFLAGQPHLLGWMQVFAAAGILYLVFEDVAPQARLRSSSFPPLGAVLGFLLGLLGYLLEG